MKKSELGVLVYMVWVLIVLNADLPHYLGLPVFVGGVDCVEDELVRVVVLTQLGETEQTHYIDGFVIYHQADVAHIATDLDQVFLYFPPEHDVKEYLKNLHHGVLVDDVLVTLDALNDDNVETVLVQNSLQEFRILTEQCETSC